MNHKLLNISEALSIAFHLCVYLALPNNKDKNISSLDVASVLNVSKNHLAKVLQRLEKVRLVRSTRGRKGGFVLNKDSNKLHLIEIYEAIDGPFPTNHCLLPIKKCNERDCLFGDLLKKTHLLFKDYFTNTTLDSLVGIYNEE